MLKRLKHMHKGRDVRHTPCTHFFNIEGPITEASITDAPTDPPTTKKPTTKNQQLKNQQRKNPLPRNLPPRSQRQKNLRRKNRLVRVGVRSILDQPILRFRISWQLRHPLHPKIDRPNPYTKYSYLQNVIGLCCSTRPTYLVTINII